MYNVKLPALIDRINTSMASWHSRTVDHNFKSARLVGSVVLCCSLLTSHVLGVYFSMVLVQGTICHLVGSSCWGDV